MRTHTQAVQDQFDPQAQAYLTSAVHAAGPDLARGPRAGRARACAHGAGTGRRHRRRAPELRAGAGRRHGSSRWIPRPGMLATVRQAAAARGLSQIETCEASADALPFAAASFDLVVHPLQCPSLVGSAAGAGGDAARASNPTASF